MLLIIICLLLTAGILAEESGHRTGQFTAVFYERSLLSSPAAIARRMGERVNEQAAEKDYEIANEAFDVYVPADCNSQMPYGLMVWISPNDKGTILKGWQPLMDKYRLIWVGANNSGNKQNTRARRIPLALDAAHNIKKLYVIDPNRIYLGGLSGGGRTASMMAFHYSDVFDGAIFIIGANYWRRTKIPSREGYVWYPAFRKPSPPYLTLAKKHGRYVFLTGDNDVNREEMHTYYERGYKKFLDNVLYIQVPAMGHEKPPAEWLEKAIEFLDNPQIQSQKVDKSIR